jgi:hypothetical protein
MPFRTAVPAKPDEAVACTLQPGCLSVGVGMAESYYESCTSYRCTIWKTSTELETSSANIRDFPLRLGRHGTLGSGAPVSSKLSTAEQAEGARKISETEACGCQYIFFAPQMTNSVIRASCFPPEIAAGSEIKTTTPAIQCMQKKANPPPHLENDQ